MTFSIEGIPATQTELVRAVQSLASSAMGIEQSLDSIAKRLSGIEDSLYPVTVKGVEDLRQAIDDIDISLTNISDSLDRQA